MGEIEKCEVGDGDGGGNTFYGLVGWLVGVEFNAPLDTI